MKHSFFKIKVKNVHFHKDIFALSSNACLGIFMFIGIVLTGLLSSACLNVSQMYAALPPDTPHPYAVLERSVRTVVDGYPIERMAPLIASYDKMTAAFLVGIAKKESNWGKRVPVDKEGNDCFNYWGYRGAGSRGIEMGHGCFGSRKEAVAVVGRRIDTLVNEYKLDSPQDFIVWKCGWNCKGHSDESVKKWISDVGIYFNKVYN